MKQRMLEIIFGKSSNKDLKQDFRYLREDFSSKDEIKIFIGSWNVGSTNLSKYPNLNLDSWLIPKDKIVPNLYFVGLQEVVELNAGNIVLNFVIQFRLRNYSIFYKFLESCDNYLILLLN